MALRGEADAIVCCMPGASDDPNDVARCIAVAIPSGSSSTLVQLPYTEVWYSVTGDQSFLLRGGNASLTASVTGDWPVWQFSYQNYWVSANSEGYVRVRGLGTGGFAYFYRSNR